VNQTAWHTIIPSLSMLRVALITTDNREDRRDYSLELPWFGTSPQALLDGFAALPDEIEVHVLSCARRRLSSPLQLAPNVFFHSVFVPSWAWLKFGYLGNIIAVRRHLRDIRPDLVHGQGTERDCAISAVFSGYPNLLTLHGNMRRLAKLAGAKPWSFASIAATLESLALRLTGGVICLSTHTRKLVSPRAKRTWIIPNGVDQRLLQTTHREPSKPPLILIIGDLLPNKNHLAFLNAILPLRETNPFEVRILGKVNPETPYAAEVIRFADQHPWCRIEGFVNHSELAGFLSKATMLAIPSLEENLPMVILEAMAAGVPVAASNVGGIPDLITDGQVGRLFDPRNPDSMRGIISHMLNNPAHNLMLANAAIARIHLHHLPDTIARQHLEVYRNILSHGMAF